MSTSGATTNMVTHSANKVWSWNTTKTLPKRSNQTLSLPMPALTLPLSRLCGPLNWVPVTDASPAVEAKAADSMCQSESIDVSRVESSTV